MRQAGRVTAAGLFDDLRMSGEAVNPLQ
jgi:hypothetical protein